MNRSGRQAWSVGVSAAVFAPSGDDGGAVSAVEASSGALVVGLA